MSDYLNALVESEKFYILPVCNLSINPSVPLEANDYLSDQEFITEWTTTGYAIGTTGGQNLGQYNDNFNEIVIPNYIKQIGIDYISFSSTPSGAATTAGQDVNEVVFNLVYEIKDGANPFIDGNGNSYNLTEEAKYYIQVKAENGKLIRIDFNNLYSIRDIIETFVDFIPAPTESPDKNNKARPYNITLWKKFLNTSSTNKNIFVKTNSLPAGCNEYINPNFIP
jgi:hypothetical protein